ncbi:MAG TPA: presqualene diphosphate synthase HpnD [Solirubrobacteraceae bacterium]|nr:presqualene diphosphate synthase HpnD [Solirubrobacteraceae bacterium]
MTTAAEIAGAYSYCEALTRAQAANFFYGIRLLPRERRRAMCAVYAFARRIDDIGDGELDAAEKLRLLDEEVRALAAIAPAGAGAGAGGREDPVMIALADAQRWFPLPADALAELIEGVRMDVMGATYEGFDELVVYCRRVAGTIGRLCLAIFGLRAGVGGDGADAEALADDLGVALQLTNILRDVREDAQNGRVYLPAQDLRRFGVDVGEEPAAAVLAALDDERRSEELSALVRFEAARAGEWFDRGMTLTGMLDRRSAACVLAMAGIYRRLLQRIEQRPEEAVRRRVSLPTREKAWVAAWALLPLPRTGTMRGRCGAGA